MIDNQIKIKKTADGYEGSTELLPGSTFKNNSELEVFLSITNELHIKNELSSQIHNFNIILHENNKYISDVSHIICSINNDNKKKILLNNMTLNGHANLMIKGMFTLINESNFTASDILLRPILENISLQFYLELIEDDLAAYWLHWMDDLASDDERSKLRKKYKLAKIIPEIYKGEKRDFMIKTKDKYNDILHLNPCITQGKYLPVDFILEKVIFSQNLLLLNRIAMIQNCYYSDTNGIKFFEETINHLVNYDIHDFWKFVPNQIIENIKNNKNIIKILKTRATKKLQ